jgi:hypothetical protein
MGIKKPDQLALNRVALTLAVFLTRPQADSNRRNSTILNPDSQIVNFG